MNLQQSQTRTVAQLSAGDESETRLHGNWLLIARAGWVALTLLVLTLSAIAVPRAYALFQSVCHPGIQCLDVQLTPVDLRLLRQLGLSPGFLAAYELGTDVATLLIHSAIATLIFWRRSQDRMALFCASMLVLLGGATYTGLLDYGLRPLAPAWYWPLGVLELMGQSGILIFLLLFPSGRFVPGWTRWGVPLVVLYEMRFVFLRDPLHNQYSPFDALGFSVLLLCLIALQIYRYRRVSTFRERQQTKWVVFGFAIALGGFALVISIGSTVISRLVSPQLWHSIVLNVLIESTVGGVLLLLIPLSIAFAILRSRLYDIDTLINRTLVYGLLTGLLATLYTGLIIGLQALVRGLTGQGSSVAIVISTLVIAALFHPLRRRIQQIIDRRFYRHKYDAARTLEVFSATLRQEVDLATLSEHLVAVVQETMQPAQISLWLRQPQQHGKRQTPEEGGAK